MNIGIFLLSFALSFPVFAKGIRTVKVNSNKMAPIKLQMGKATVLRFQNPPKKIVVGNQNYFSIEFIENDLTIQPLNNVETNLFVYTAYRTYGFTLRACFSCSHDDLVFVKWKSRTTIRSKHKKPHKKISKKQVHISIGEIENIFVKLIGVETQLNSKLMFLDFEISNLGKTIYKTNNLKLLGTRRGTPILDQGYVVESLKIEPKQTSRARLFLPRQNQRSIQVVIINGKNKKRKTIPFKYLNP